MRWCWLVKGRWSEREGYFVVNTVFFIDVHICFLDLILSLLVGGSEY